MFLQSLLQRLEQSYFVDGGNATKTGIIDYLHENRPRYLLIDEINKMSSSNQTFLLSLMETGITSESKYGKTRQAKMNTSVFATRFFVVELEPYSYSQFYEITPRLFNNQSKIAPTVDAGIWKSTKSIRDCVRIGKLARSEEDVNFLVNMLHSNGMMNICRGEEGI